MHNKKALPPLKPVLYKVAGILHAMKRNGRALVRAHYHNHLAKFGFFRLALSLTRKLCSELAKGKTILRHQLYAKRYPLINRSDFLAAHLTSIAVFDNGSKKKIKGPRFIGVDNITLNVETDVSLVQPRLDLVNIKNAAIMGGTNYILVNGNVVHPDQYDPARDVCPAELNRVARVDHFSNYVSMVFRSTRAIEKGVSLLGCCTGNYAHWLTETLPKVIIIDNYSDYDDYPLIVDDWIHPNFIESIRLVSAKNRPLIRINRWEAVNVASLVDLSPTAYIPPEYRTFVELQQLSEPDPGDFPFSSIALKLLRETAYKSLSIRAQRGDVKLFLHRPRESCGNIRLVENIDEVESIVRSYGYVFLDPAKLSFEEQVVVFSSASHIISPLGAAMANLIFTPPGCRILGLSPYYDKANYYYFSNFMGALGHDLSYVLGQQTSNIGHPFHRPYAVDLAALSLALDSISGTVGKP